MFKNRNTKIVNKVVRKILATQKLKSLVTIIAIGISAMLFTSLATLTVGTVKSQTLMMQLQAGSKADVEIKGMTQPQYEQLVKLSVIKEAGLRRTITYLSNTQHHNIELDYMDEKAQELFFSKPTHGKAPKSFNEVATSDKALKDLGVTPKVGEKLTIVYKLKGNQQEYSYEMILSGWWEATNEQSSLMLVSNKFINQNSNILESNRAYDFELGRYSAEIILKDRQKTDEKLKKIVREVGGDPENQLSNNFTPIVINRNTAMELAEIFFPAALIIFLFLICSYLLIYNVFDIAVAKDIKSYGLLSTIGATAAQIKTIVFKQAFFLAIIGIPIGLLTGFFIGNGLLPIVLGGMMAEEYSNIPIVNGVNPIIFIFSSVITLITIFISIYKPAKLAAKYSAVEASKYTECNKAISGKNIKNKILQIAYSNFMRNKKRAVLIVTSLAICIIFFNSIFIVSSSMDEKKFVSVNMKTDYIAANADSFNLDKGYVYRDDGMSKNFCEFLESLVGVKKIGYMYKNTKDDRAVSFDYGIPIDEIETFSNDEGINEQFGKIKINGIELGAPLADDKRLSCNVFGADDVTLERFSFDDSLENMSDEEAKKNFLSGDYIIEGAMIDPSNPTEIAKIPGYQTSLGQKVMAYKNGELYKTYTVIAQMPVIQAEVEANDGANGATRVGQDAAKFYLPFSEFSDLYDEPTLLNCTFDAIDGDTKKEINSKLSQYTEDNPSMGYYSSEAMERAIINEQQKVFVVGGIMAGVLGIVGIINFINLIITSIISRKSDFAIMESIGMTQNQLRKMVVLEGAFYAVATGVLGLTISYIIGITAIKKILSLTWYYTFKMSLYPGIFIWISMLLVVVISSRIAINIFNKGNLSERLSLGE